MAIYSKCSENGQWPVVISDSGPLSLVTSYLQLVITQLFETLQPGSNGVLTNVDKIPKEKFRKVALDMMDLLSYHALSERKSEPLKKNDEKNHEAGESEQEGHLSQQDREEL